jgi:hypothetical protein
MLYAKFCGSAEVIGEVQLGGFLHHTTVTDRDELSDKHSRCHRLIELYREIFKENPTGQHWELERPGVLSDCVFIKMLGGKTRAVEITDDTIVLDLKNAVFRADGTPVCEQRLIFSGKDLQDARTLASYNIKNHSTISLVKRLTGC